MTNVNTTENTNDSNYSTETENVFDMIAQAIVLKETNADIRKDMKTNFDQTIVGVALAAIAHCQKFGDIRPLGRVYLQLKPSKQVLTMIRMCLPDLKAIKHDKNDDWNTFSTTFADGTHAGNMTFDTELLEEAESILTASKSDGNSPFAKGHGWEDTFPDNAPINKTKKLKSVKKSIIKTMDDLKKKGGGNLTKAEWVELINAAYADFQQAQSTAPSPDDH